MRPERWEVQSVDPSGSSRCLLKYISKLLRPSDCLGTFHGSTFAWDRFLKPLAAKDLERINAVQRDHKCPNCTGKYLLDESLMFNRWRKRKY